MISLCLDLLTEANLKVIPTQMVSVRETPELTADETPRRPEPITHWSLVWPGKTLAQVQGCALPTPPEPGPG